MNPANLKIKEFYRNMPEINTKEDVISWMQKFSVTADDFDAYFRSEKNNNISFFSEHLAAILNTDNLYFIDYMLNRYNEQFSTIKHTDKFFIIFSENKGFENIFSLLYQHNILPQKTDILGNDLLSYFFEAKNHKAFECLLSLGHEPVFYQINNSLDNAISNMNIDNLIYFKSKGFDITKNISYDKVEDQALNTIRDCYYSKKDKEKILQLFKLYSNELTHQELNTYFNKMLFNLHYETIIALKEQHEFFIIPELKNEIMNNCISDISDTQSLYRKDGIQKLNLILDMGINFSELNKDERFLKKAIQDFAPLPFIKALVDKGASITQLDALIPEGILYSSTRGSIKHLEYLNYFMTHNVKVNKDLLYHFYRHDLDFAKDKKYNRLIENIFLKNEPDYDFCEFQIYIDSEKRTRPSLQRRAGSVSFYMGSREANVNALTYLFYQNEAVFCNILKSLTINEKNISGLFKTFDAIIKCGNQFRAHTLLSQLKKKDPEIFVNYVSNIENKDMIDNNYFNEIKAESIEIMKKQLQKNLKSIKIQKKEPVNNKRL